MKRPHSQPSILATLLVVTLLTAACTTPGKPAAQTAPSGQPLPSDPNALVLGAEVALQRGQYREASMAYVRAATAASDEQLWTLVSQVAAHWLQLNQTSEEAHRFAAFAALHLYQIDPAAEHLSTLLE